MMQTMRENTKKVLWVLIIAFIGTIIFAWGMGGFDRNSQVRSGVLAIIDGEKILQQDFDNRVEQRIQQEREKNNNQDLDENRVRTLRNEVWDGIINEILLEQELDRLGVSIGTREIAYELRNNPPQYVQQAEVFQNNGQFYAAKYED
ncbi:MAG: SurA N-terminal domain-containing protein, partial [bacterium]|nr:SurA N-terminal domain-containing protein [bacterium]